MIDPSLLSRRQNQGLLGVDYTHADVMADNEFGRYVKDFGDVLRMTTYMTDLTIPDLIRGSSGMITISPALIAEYFLMGLDNFAISSELLPKYISEKHEGEGSKFCTFCSNVEGNNPVGHTVFECKDPRCARSRVPKEERFRLGEQEAPASRGSVERGRGGRGRRVHRFKFRGRGGRFRGHKGRGQYRPINNINTSEDISSNAFPFESKPTRSSTVPHRRINNSNRNSRTGNLPNRVHINAINHNQSSTDLGNQVNNFPTAQQNPLIPLQIHQTSADINSIFDINSTVSENHIRSQLSPFLRLEISINQSINQSATDLGNPVKNYPTALQQLSIPLKFHHTSSDINSIFDINFTVSENHIRFQRSQFNRLEISINDMKMIAIIDSAAFCSVIIADLAEQCHMSINSKDTIKFLLANNVSTKSLGSATGILSFNVGSIAQQVHYKHTLPIIPGSNKLLIGTDMLKALRLQTDDGLFIKLDKEHRTLLNAESEFDSRIAQHSIGNLDNQSPSPSDFEEQLARSGCEINLDDSNNKLKLTSLLRLFSDVFSETANRKGIDCNPLTIPFRDENAIVHKPARRLNPSKMEIANKIFDELIEMGYAVESNYKFSSFYRLSYIS
ncbi:hypothetical protein P9112_005495 [Eukaryota sp. TZLM1-RC]